MYSVSNGVDSTIEIFDPVLQNTGRRILNHIKVPPHLRPYFEDFVFYAEYERDVSAVPESILNIPALSSIIHFAWAVGCNVVVGEIDKTYFSGIEKSRRFLKEHPAYKNMSFDSIVSGDVIENDFGGDKAGLLFSGGADSTASYIAHRHQNPQLITIRGIDMPLRWSKFWQRVIDLYGWMNPTTIITNTDEIYSGIHQGYFSRKARIVEGYKPGYSFSVNRLGVCAPLTVVEGINELMMSSTYPAREYGDPAFPWSNNRINFKVDEWLSWANVKVHDVETEYSTTEKIKDLIKPYFEKHGTLLIRSCGHVKLLGPRRHEIFNCTHCDKCQRVIGSLVVSGIDPRTCGFNTTEKTYQTIRTDIERKTWNPLYLKYHWEEVRGYIPDVIEGDFGGSRAFLEWLRDYEFD